MINKHVKEANVSDSEAFERPGKADASLRCGAVRESRGDFPKQIQRLDLSRASVWFRFIVLLSF